MFGDLCGLFKKSTRASPNLDAFQRDRRRRAVISDQGLGLDQCRDEEGNAGSNSGRGVLVSLRRKGCSANL
ncbi:hypothetical protein B296_00055354 [Ensete ventricosum]|uniref:Uncharacterized protein n=1 Tax=Ensete ventricosum TaxID=4639 RepID=A0A426Y025_ENSVE|nr:hypothetical protein B296_00055354 [Ensete ventricosum]